ncbi:MAG: tryptophan 7-halogenase, partial [Sinobacteraceae bacterium]|nr:tryptophan 7-halogenase [Nevskiaceae bacterium]
VKHLIDTVTQVNRSEDGSLASVDTGEHGTVEADFFVDCTGFAGLLIGRSMEVPFISYNDALFNDRAVTLPTPQVTADHGLSSETLSGAMKHGWLFKIPLTNRFGNGYVYCSAYCSAEDAEAELRDKLNLHDESIQARHLKMRVGRRERCWEKNCLAVGLSQGFIEPLEATALFLVAATVEDFVATYERGSTDAKVRATFNDKISGMFDGVRDYVFMHFKLNTRADTPYWRDCRDANACSDLVEEFLRVWDHDGDIGHVLDLLKANGQRLVYTPTSWVCMLAGMGRFPSGAKKPRANQQVVDPKVAYRHCEEFVRQFPDHRQALAALQATA